jgi:site-specific DNA-methyltransferase (adenine-specific)
MIHLGDCLDVLKTLSDNSIDSIITDPPYGLRFMAKKWDYDVPSIDVWRECLRVLKPGGHMLVACGTRTQHRMVAPIEDAGFEIRDVITWLYGSGFPKSLDVSKAIDKEAGASREIVGVAGKSGSKRSAMASDFTGGEYMETAPATDAAKQWEGFGTALKPAVEFWTLARKPLSESTVAKNVLKWGTGGINVDGCRVEGAFESGWSKSGSKASENVAMSGANYAREPKPDNAQGRFPANLILDEEAGAALDEQSGFSVSTQGKKAGGKTFHGVEYEGKERVSRNDSGGASRFFYCAKASKSDRGQGNGHPTVKPTSLMAYLCRLITPPGGTVLDPFTGSGSTGVAAIREGFSFVGIEREAEYVEIAKARINAAS